MADPYAVGTVSVANGSTTVTGTSTFWIGNVRKNDLFSDPAQGIFARVTADPTSNTELSINAWPGTDLSGDAYEIISTGDSTSNTARLRDLLADMTVVKANGRGLFYTFADQTTDSDPGAGTLRLNNLDPTLATAAYIDNLDANGATASGIIDTWDDADALKRGQLWLRSVSEPSSSFAYWVTGSVVDGTGYRKLTLDYIGGSGSFAAADAIMVVFNMTGDKGEAYVTDATVADPSELTALEGEAAGYLVFVTDLQTDFGAYSGRSGVVKLIAGPDWQLEAIYTGPQGVQGIQGIQGIQGEQGIVWVDDAWDSGTTYAKDEGTQRDGSSWRSLQDGNLNHTPPSYPTISNAWWALVARRGIDGAGTVSSVVGGDGIAVDGTDPTAPEVSVVAFTGDSGSGGAIGGVPAPTAGDAAANKFLKADGTWDAAGLGAASQAEQEAGTSNTVAVTPGRQQSHPSAAKAWAYITVSGGVPSVAASYNVDSITDADTGRLIVNLTTPFSSANYAVVATPGRPDSAAAYVKIRSATVAAGQFEIMAFNAAGTLIDPDSYYFIAFGDQ